MEADRLADCETEFAEEVLDLGVFRINVQAADYEPGVGRFLFRESMELYALRLEVEDDTAIFVVAPTADKYTITCSERQLKY